MKAQVSTSFQTVYYSEKKQSFTFQRKQTQKISNHFQPLWVCSISRFEEFRQHLLPTIKNISPFVSFETINKELDHFIVDSLIANRLLVEAKEILGVE